MRRYLSLFLVALAAPAWAADKPFFFQKGDRVVFLGDSITEQYQYSTYVELYLTTRFPEWKLAFINAGIGGDTAHGGAARFQAHVLNEKPTAITINFGMNDAGYQKFDANRNKVYVEKTQAMLDMAKQAGVRVALMSPNAVDRRKSPGFSNFGVYLETQKQFYAPLRDLAEKGGATFVDQYAVTRAALEKMEADKADKVVPYYDGFHTSPPGGLLMAHAILTGLNAPALVSQATIDAGAKSASGEKCQVSDLSVSDDAVSFNRLDEAVPMPILPDWVSILPYVNDLKDLNHYGLIVKGLKQGIWEIRIDGTAVSQSSAQDLAAGINLGNVTKGPIHAHGMKIFGAIEAKNRVVHDRFRGIMLYQPPAWLQIDPADLKAKKEAEAAKRVPAIERGQAGIHDIAKPMGHKFELRFVK